MSQYQALKILDVLKPNKRYFMLVSYTDYMFLNSFCGWSITYRLVAQFSSQCHRQWLNYGVTLYVGAVLCHVWIESKCWMSRSLQNLLHFCFTPSYRMFIFVFLSDVKPSLTPIESRVFALNVIKTFRDATSQCYHHQRGI